VAWDRVDLQVPRQARHSQVELHPASARTTRKVLPVMICRAVGMRERKKAGAVNPAPEDASRQA
jgi:hypothetical protein